MLFVNGFPQATPLFQICGRASSVSRHDAHICVKPENRATTRGQLRNINAARGYPNEDAVIMPQGWERQAEGIRGYEY
jgi:hypothetical protein